MLEPDQKIITISGKLSSAVKVSTVGGVYAQENLFRPYKSQIFKSKPHSFLKRQNNQKEICSTPVCKNIASTIIEDTDFTKNPCEDFYEYSCGGWLSRTTIPADKSYYGRFDIIENESQARIKELGVKPLSPILFQIFLRFPARQQIPPAAQVNSKFDHIDKEKLTNTLDYLLRIDVNSLFQFQVESDFKEPEKYALFLSQPDFGLPSKEYYGDIEVLKAYQGVIKELLEKSLTGGNIMQEQWGHVDFDKISQDIIEFEKKLVDVSLSRSVFCQVDFLLILTKIKQLSNLAGFISQQLNDIETIYNTYTISYLENLSPAFNWTKLIGKLLPIGTDIPSKIILTSNEFFGQLSIIIQKTPTSILQSYLLWKTILKYAEYLSEDFRISLRKLTAPLNGVSPDAIPDRWKDCLDTIDPFLGFMTGRFYVLERFGGKLGDSKNVSEQLTLSIRQAFIKRLTSLDWLDDETKQKAIKKANAIFQKIGYPTTSPNTMNSKSLADYYDKLSIDADEFFQNVVRGYQWIANRDWGRVGKPVDRGDWELTPQTANAYYKQQANEIVIPAGILQSPFFDATQPEYINAASIGVIIGHELTHGFDSNGRRFDETGRLNEWWSNTTLTMFKEKSKCFLNQYNDFTIQNTKGQPLHVNGELTLGENLADNGGMRTAYDAWLSDYKSDSNQRSRKNYLLPGLEQYTPEQIFYISFANIWCSKIRPEDAVRMSRVDSHSPDKWRVIGPLRNSPEFAKAFKCESGTPMNPVEKCQLW
ncbi:hypothetical protein G9A89_001724 [Geosiphon pyriformis]|nr:hypothetical protein G9A89_001724 [Geosiphon pyriformis]